MADKKVPEVLVRFGSKFPPSLEAALADYGFELYARKHNKWVIYKKKLQPKGVIKEPNEVELWAPKLEERINKIVDAFLDPYSNINSIREQLFNLAKGLPGEQEQFVLTWMKNNLDNEYFVPPWEDDKLWEDLEIQGALGSC